MLRNRVNFVVLIFLFMQVVLFSQTNDKVFYKLSPNDYQSRRCFSVIKTENGFIWYVTEDGVCRYDGKFVKNYPIEIKWKGFLKEDSKGDLYLCTSDGFGYKYNESKDHFDVLFQVTRSLGSKTVEDNKKTTPKEIPTAFPKLSHTIINSVSIDIFGRIWLGTRQGPVCYNPHTNQWITLGLNWLNNSFVLAESDKLYIFTPKSINYIDIKNNEQSKITLHVIKNSSINNEITDALFESTTGNFYIGTLNKGLYCYTKKGEINRLIPLNNSTVSSIKMYDQNIILVGFDGLGIYEYDIYTERIIDHHLVDDNKVGSLGSNAVYEIFVDYDKRIWVANYTTGIDVYDPNMINFSRFSHIMNNENSLGHDNVLSIAEDKYKNIWFGTYNGLSVKKKSNGAWSHFLVNNSQTQTNGYVNTLKTDQKGNVWAGGAFGLISINPENFRIKAIDFNNTSYELTANGILTILPDNETLWAGGLQSNLVGINILNDKVKQYIPKSIRSIEYEDNNHLLLCDDKIISFNKMTGRMDFKMDSLIKTQTQIQDPQYLSIHQKEDNVWFTTKSYGIIQYSKSTNLVFVYNKDTGLPSNRVLSLEIDNNDCLWIATDEGFCYLNPVTKIVIPFKTFPGSEKGLYNLNASTKLSDGTMLFGTKEGAIGFDPKKMFISSPKRGSLAFTDFILLNKNRKTRTFEEISKLPLNKCLQIDLKSYENSFTLKFEELIYSKTILPRYSYKLSGYDKSFSSLSTEGEATYYSLPSGKYTLEIHSYFTDKEGKFVVRTIDVIVLQPWYNTIWAWIIWILITTAITIAIYRYSKHRLDIRYSNEKINFFTNISHDMRTPITLIKAPLGDLLIDPSLSSSSRHLVQMINNNVNRLLDMINRVLDFEKIDEQDMKLNVEGFELNKYVTEIVENYLPYAEISSITIRAEVKKDPLLVYFDKEKMNMVIENLISNSIKYSISGGIVNIITGSNDTNWWIEISDNGIGIPKKEQKLIFKRFYRAENAINSKKIGSGMGLLLVYNLTQFMGGDVSFNSEEGVKTTFKVSFQLSNAPQKAHENILDISGNHKNKVEITPIDIVIPTLLFVDDNDEIRNYISARLALDYNILTAESATEAWTILHKEKVNIIITDIMMPQVSGIELCERIKSDSMYAHIPVVLLSALSDKKDIIKGLQIGADDYITKPFDSVILKQRIDNILTNRKHLAKYLLSNKEEPSQINNQPFISDMDKLFIEKIAHTFDRNISNSEYTIDSLCRDIGMSRTVFYNRLKNLINIAPNDYLRILRLERAAELLLGKQYSVNEVSEMVGYNDVKYFSSLFRKKYGCLPTQYMHN